MKKLIVRILVVGLLFSLCSSSVLAAKYTKTGAIAGANSSGEITAFVGKKGLVCPADFQPGDYVSNPYEDETPLYRIDRSNIEKYKTRLAPGQIARIKKNKNFHLNVYPTHRNFIFPKVFNDATARNRKTSKVDRNQMLKGFNGGIPFPIPQNGLEAIWNIKKQFSGDDVKKTETRRIVSPSGRIRKEVQYTRVINLDKNRLFSKIANPDRASRKIISLYTYPADRAGGGLLIVNYLDDRRNDATWLYIPILRRVRRAPTMSRGTQIDGESTLDEFGYFFRGPVDDWNWRLLGRKEMYIPVNAYGMWEVGTPDKEECLPGDINPKSLRYELRRVWAVEGTAKAGLDHPYSKRVFYADEDNWYATVGEVYDKRGNLWRMSEFYTYLDYCQDYRTVVSMIYLNLESGRYELLGGGRTPKTKTIILNSSIKNRDFT
ncbi:MAG: DUF1329 domain-containing protein, partial [Proteobacteria bacterium]|nr:DUF1329 domain-containing protein [Pseudomonadota bacterium]